MGRKSQENEICTYILNELYDIKQKKGITFNNLFKTIKTKRGKFSYDTLSKYLKKMENDGRIIRIIDVNSNRKIKPTHLYKNSEIINLQNEKINVNKILMDNTTKFRRFSNKDLRDSDLYPKFNEIIFNFFEKEMNLNLKYFETDEIITKELLLNNFNLFLVENPEVKGTIKNFNDIVLLFFLNLLDLMLDSGLINSPEIHYNLLFNIDFHELIASIILQLTNKIIQDQLPLSDLFLKKIKLEKPIKFTQERILQALLSQLQGELKEPIKDLVQKKRFEEFSEKYKTSLKIY